MSNEESSDERAGPLPVEILGLQIIPSTGASIVLLGRLETTDRVLPIFIGPAEAQSIGLALEGVVPPRPITHDLFVATIDAAGARITDLLITSLEHDTFLAELGLATDSGERRVDARPSDGLALALRVGAPVRVDRRVFEAASVEIVTDPRERFSDDEIDRIVTDFRSFIDSADPSDFEHDEPGEP
jgi:uncharacterized protein